MMLRPKVLAFPRTRKLCIADPTGNQQTLCGKSDYPEMRGFLTEHPPETICKRCCEEAAIAEGLFV